MGGRCGRGRQGSPPRGRRWSRKRLPPGTASGSSCDLQGRVFGGEIFSCAKGVNQCSSRLVHYSIKIIKKQYKEGIGYRGKGIVIYFLVVAFAGLFFAAGFEVAFLATGFAAVLLALGFELSAFFSGFTPAALTRADT